MRFSKRSYIFCFVFFMLETDKQKKGKKKKQNGKRQKTYKNSVFEGGPSKIDKMKKMDSFCKNCLTLFVSGKETTRIFVHTDCFGQKHFWDQNSENQKKL